MNLNELITLYRHDLASYFRFSFNELHAGAEYLHNWHLDVIAYYLKQVTGGKIQKLIINTPPRSLKSECVSIFLSSWMLGRNPRQKILCLHGHKSLGRDLHDDCWEIMQSKRYRALFPSMVTTEDGSKIKTNHGGHRQHLPLMGRLTGLGADTIVVDDPMSTEEAHCDTIRKEINRQFDENVCQRVANKKTGAVIVVMQRLHEDDLTGHLLAKNDGWVHLNFSAIAMEDEVWSLPCGKTYHRKKGAALHPERESREDLMNILHSIGGYAFAYQYLQGLYKPRFGESGHGSIWLTDWRDNVPVVPSIGQSGLYGFYHFTEAQLMLSKVFGIGEDPCPDNMRTHLTPEEWQKGADQVLAYQEELRRAYDEKSSS